MFDIIKDWDVVKEWTSEGLRGVKAAPRVAVFGGIVGLFVGGWLAGFVYRQTVQNLRDHVELLREALARNMPNTAQPIEPSGALAWTTAGVAIVVVIVLLLERVRSRRTARSMATTSESAIGELDRQNTELKGTVEQFAIQTLRFYQYSGLKRLVLIQHSSYGDDYAVVERIKFLVTEYVGWPVETEASNKLPKAEQWKVIFDIGEMPEPLNPYAPLVRAFRDGNLLDVTVGWPKTARQDIDQRLLVIVLPSAPEV